MTPDPKQHALLCWIIWFVFFQAAFIYHFVLSDGFPSGVNVEEPMALWLWLICLIPLAVATAIRWLVLTKPLQPKPQLVAMIIGVALCEAAILFEIFLIGSDYPQNQVIILALAVFGLIQFAPTYATPGLPSVKTRFG
jgi:hypothetical protein